jgi:hypothetical protein
MLNSYQYLSETYTRNHVVSNYSLKQNPIFFAISKTVFGFLTAMIPEILFLRKLTTLGTQSTLVWTICTRICVSSSDGRYEKGYIPIRIQVSDMCQG